MRKKTIIVIVTVFAMIFVLAGCGKSELSFNMNEDQKSAVITMENASKDDFVTSGALLIEDGDTVYIEPAFEGDGEINIKLTGAISGEVSDDEDDSEELPEPNEDIAELISGQDPVLDVDINGTGTTECTLPAGEYYVSVTVLKKATGTVTLRAENPGMGMANPWTDAASAEEAANGAGLDTFTIPAGSEISLGSLDLVSYRYMEGMAEAQIPVAAVEMYIRKGFGEEDVSGDYNTYKNEWTQNIKGLEVKCFGNREGEATKTIWTSGDYSYAVLAYGAGGDDDFGLSADDLNSLINGIQ